MHGRPAHTLFYRFRDSRCVRVLFPNICGIQRYIFCPNSCFVDAMIYASQCNLLLETNNDIWNNVYGFTFYYKDDIDNIIGHAVCVFEYKNNLWIYDPNWGTSPICKVGDQKQYREKIKLYINKTYPIIVVEDFMLNDWTYVQKIKNYSGIIK